MGHIELIETYPIIAIDPGTNESGVVVFDGKNVLMAKPKMDNHHLIEQLVTNYMYGGGDFAGVDNMAIEMVASYGMPVGQSTFETVLWIGRFIQAFGADHSTKIYRKDIKMFLCGSMRAKDSNIRQAIIDLFPATGGGKVPQVGIKNKMGPLFGVSSHSFSALAVAITYKYGGVI